MVHRCGSPAAPTSSSALITTLVSRDCSPIVDTLSTSLASPSQSPDAAHKREPVPVAWPMARSSRSWGLLVLAAVGVRPLASPGLLLTVLIERPGAAVR